MRNVSWYVVMMPPNKKPLTKSKQIALSGVLSALSISIMLVGGILPISTFVAPMFAGFCMLPILFEVGTKIAFVMYFSVSIVSFLLVPDREMFLFFIFLFGYYPILRPQFQKIKIKIVRYISKLLLLNATAVVATLLFLFIFAAPSVRQEYLNETRWFQVLFLVMGNITFILYDHLIEKLTFVYYLKFRKLFFK